MATPSSPSTPTHMQSSPMYGSSLPTLNFSSTNLDNEWKKWKLHFSIFLKASALDETEESRLVSLLLHHMGPNAIPIFMSFGVEIDKIKYQDLILKFDNHFSPKKNVTMERHKFFNCKQAENQTMNDFIMQLRNLAKTCEFKEAENIIRDILICNLHSRFSFIKERLLELGDVKLEKTIETAQNLETSRQHLQELESQSVVLQVKSQPKKTNDRRGKNYGRPGSRVSDQQRNKCPRCGQVHHHKCPATGQICKKCGKPNHCAIMCRSAPQSNGVKTKEVVPLNTLELNCINTILNGKLVTTVYGECILLELKDKRVFLPKRATSVLKTHLDELNSQKYGIKFIGMKEITGLPASTLLFQIVLRE
ncbi:uncharacterized protein LOC123308281 isoform X1 [Coccinella septempunctata]|uniref:uncharacterized protein LOC123308281 isoform X1 n=1 Tax=Coccinella septempunctata TaxID=41139 RepID=UPI001D08ECDB|nr:uncharacterized protein LOC123308281 isoform X1 [Coccinella septempunctata]